MLAYFCMLCTPMYTYVLRCAPLRKTVLAYFVDVLLMYCTCIESNGEHSESNGEQWRAHA